MIKNVLRKPAIREGSIVVIDQGILSLATFIAGVLVARSTSAHDYGLYVLGWSIILMSQGVFRNLIVVPLTVYTPRMESEERLTYQGSTLIHTLVYSAAILLFLSAIWLLLQQKPQSEQKTLADLIPLIALAIPALIWRELIRNVLLAQLKIFASVSINILATVLIVLVIGLMYAEETLTSEKTFMCFFGISGAAAIYMNYKFKDEFIISASAIWRDFVKGWTISKWASLNVVGFIGMSQLYPWMLVFFIDHESVAIYGACLGAASLISPIMRGANAYILPRISHGFKVKDNNRLRNLTNKSVLALLIPYTLWMLIALIFHAELVPLFYSDKYQGYGMLFLLLALKISIDSVTSPLNSALQTAEQAGQTTAALIAGAVITLILGPILIELYGVTGAGVAAVIASTISATWKFKALRAVTG